MEDLYVNVNFASKFLWKSIVLFMSYVELFRTWILNGLFMLLMY